MTDNAVDAWPSLLAFRASDTVLFHDLLSAPMFHHSVWSVITAHNLTPAKRDVTTVVSDQLTLQPSIDYRRL